MWKGRYGGAMNIAIASCRDLPDWEVDDRALYEALDQQQVGWRLVAWDAPDVDWSTFDAVSYTHLTLPTIYSV